MAGNEEEEELDNTVLQEPQPGPGEEIRWREKAFLAMQLFSVAILYFYVVIVIFFVLVVPASITPLIHHSVNDSRGESSTDNGMLVNYYYLMVTCIIFVFRSVTHCQVSPSRWSYFITFCATT